jgi:hypothetical protein
LRVGSPSLIPGTDDAVGTSPLPSTSTLPRSLCSSSGTLLAIAGFLDM